MPALLRRYRRCLIALRMVSGERRNDLALMRAGRGDWVTKIGAEGVQAIGVRSRGWGIAIKVADGNARGLHPATVAALDQLGLLDLAAQAELASWGRPVLKNFRGTVVGGAQSVVVLDKVDLPTGAKNSGPAK